MEVTAEMKAQAVEAMQAAQAVVDDIARRARSEGQIWDLAITARNATCDALLAVCGYEWRKAA